MPGYPLSVRKPDQYILEQEAARKGCAIKDLIRESVTRKLEELRGGVGTRRRRREEL